MGWDCIQRRLWDGQGPLKVSLFQRPTFTTPLLGCPFSNALLLKLMFVINNFVINNLIQYKYQGTPNGQFTCVADVHMINEHIGFGGLFCSANKQSTGFLTTTFEQTS